MKSTHSIINVCFNVFLETAIFLGVLLPVTGQNHVSNPSFETCTFLSPPGITYCPDDNSQMWKASGWNESWLPVPYDASMENWTYGSADYSRIGDFIAYMYDSRTPHTGNGFAGSFQFSPMIPNMREYIVNKLSSPLAPGQQYSVSFWAIMPNPDFAKLSIDKLGVYFSVSAPPCTNTSAPCNAGSALMSVTPQVVTPAGVFPNGSWQQYNMTFTATDAYQYMTFGNFSTDALTNYSTLFPLAGSNVSYIVVDDFDVHPINPLPVELYSYSIECNEKFVTISWVTASEINCAGFIIERSSNGSIWEHIDFVSGAGNTNTLQYYQYCDPINESGGYYYRLLQIDFDGNIETLPVINTICRKQQIVVTSSHHAVNFAGVIQPIQVRIFDLLGHTIFEGMISENTSVSLSENVSSVIVLIEDEDGNNTQKIILKD